MTDAQLYPGTQLRSAAIGPAYRYFILAILAIANLRKTQVIGKRMALSRPPA
jgi:uncharacterized protein YaaW (UPF0174 family)